VFLLEIDEPTMLARLDACRGLSRLGDSVSAAAVSESGINASDLMKAGVLR